MDGRGNKCSTGTENAIRPKAMAGTGLEADQLPRPKSTTTQLAASGIRPQSSSSSKKNTDVHLVESSLIANIKFPTQEGDDGTAAKTATTKSQRPNKRAVRQSEYTPP